MSDVEKSLNEILHDVTEAAGEKVAEALREKLENLMEDVYNNGFVRGCQEGEERATVPDARVRMEGEAHGLAWAYHAAKGHQVVEMTNPFANPNIVRGLLEISKG